MHIYKEKFEFMETGLIVMNRILEAGFWILDATIGF